MERERAIYYTKSGLAASEKICEKCGKRHIYKPVKPEGNIENIIGKNDKSLVDCALFIVNWEIISVNYTEIVNNYKE
jgi:hypothetical protein